jgi:RNase P subunit RPR2
MIWDDDDKAINQWDIAKKSDDLINKISKLKQKSSLTISENELLQEYTKELHEMQEKCYHNYKVVLLFHWHRKYCERCHKEDTSYRHDG